MSGQLQKQEKRRSDHKRKSVLWDGGMQRI